ncbi:hypothetical protein BACEGG_00315, partial [Bacteroides eggerthii DSM 20697]
MVNTYRFLFSCIVKQTLFYSCNRLWQLDFHPFTLIYDCFFRRRTYDTESPVGLHAG